MDKFELAYWVSAVYCLLFLPVVGWHTYRRGVDITLWSVIFYLAASFTPLLNVLLMGITISMVIVISLVYADSIVLFKAKKKNG